MAGKGPGPKRKLWTEESMSAAIENVKQGSLGLREASRLYNVPVESLRRRVTGAVDMHCRPGPKTVLTDEEEKHFAEYLVRMSDMGFGLTKENVMRMAFRIVDRSKREHPFSNGSAGRAWFEGFCRRHPKLTIRTPQPLLYCRALCSNRSTLDDFYGKLGGLYGKLNLIAKPMLIYNCDETGVTNVFKHGKVVAELGRRNVYSVSAAERGKTHTVLSCVSASGSVLPPMIVYPRKRPVPEKWKKGAPPNTLFTVSESGWSNADLFLKWFDFFINNIPPMRPVLLLLDGHGSHISIELIELAQRNNIHILCFPAHTTHLLLPLDVGVFKSFKSFFNKSCGDYLTEYPGRVVTTEVIAMLVAKAYLSSFTPVNIMSGFKKSGVFPLNPGAISEQQIAPSLALKAPAKSSDFSSEPALFSPEKEDLFKKRYEEHYDLRDPEYECWLKINHPEDISESASETSKTSSNSSKNNPSPRSDALSEVLVYPKPQEKKSVSKRKPAVNKVAVCITNNDVLEKLKEEEEEKVEAEKKRAAKKQERERKRAEKEKKKEEIAKRKKEKEEKKQKSSVSSVRSGRGKRMLHAEFAAMKLDSTSSSEAESDATCPKCGLVYSEGNGGVWVSCDGCSDWFDFKCTGLKNKRKLPEFFYCDKCA